MPEVSRWNTLVSDGLSFATRIPGVFAGGDVSTGPSVAIDCIAAGQRASHSINAFLTAAGNGRLDLRDVALMAQFNSHTAPRCDYVDPIVMRKDLTVEVRSREILYTTAFFAVSCVLVFAFAAATTRRPDSRRAWLISSSL